MIRKLPIPKAKCQLKGFIGKVSNLSMYLPRLQLQPIHKICCKKADIVWPQEHQKAYDVILQLLVKPPVSSLPINNGLFRLYCNTSPVGVGASLWRVQDGKERLLEYFSTALPKAQVTMELANLR